MVVLRAWMAVFPDTSWLIPHEQTYFGRLKADLFHAFAAEAMALMARRHPGLVLSSDIKDEKDSIPILEKFVYSIPKGIGLGRYLVSGRGTRLERLRLMRLCPKI